MGYGIAFETRDLNNRVRMKSCIAIENHNDRNKSDKGCAARSNCLR